MTSEKDSKRETQSDSVGGREKERNEQNIINQIFVPFLNTSPQIAGWISGTKQAAAQLIKLYIFTQLNTMILSLSS